MRKLSWTIALVVALALLVLPTRAQEADPVVALQVRINQIRLREGLAPYGFSSLLSAAAQRHADDVAAHGFVDPNDVHLGSDGTRERERVIAAGYAAWRRNGGDIVADENMWAGHGTVDDAMGFFLGSPVHRGNLLSATYREIGVGVAAGGDGTRYYVLVFSARPNVLPIFINDGAASTDNPQVAVRLTNEEARPEGEGTAYMGRAIELRINDEPNWDDEPWQPWAELIPWTLPETPGEHTVYVQFRDAAGRTAAAADAIVLTLDSSPAPPTAALPTAVLPTPTLEPPATPIPPSPTPEPTALPEPTDAPTVSPVAEPTLTTVVVPTPVAPSPTPAAMAALPFPTWTPLPTAAPPQEADNPLPAWLAGAVVLQGLVIVLGAALVLRRGRGR